MARGFESKSVESQQEEAARERVIKPTLTPEQRVQAERRAALEMSRTRAVADLGRANAPQHRNMLQQAIATIDEQLAHLSR